MKLIFILSFYLQESDMVTKSQICRITLNVFYEDQCPKTIKFTKQLQSSIHRVTTQIDLEHVPRRKMIKVFELPRGIEFEINPFSPDFSSQLEMWTRDKRFQKKLLYGIETLRLTRKKYQIPSPVTIISVWIYKWKVLPVDAFCDVFNLIYYYIMDNILFIANP